MCRILFANGKQRCTFTCSDKFERRKSLKKNTRRWLLGICCVLLLVLIVLAVVVRVVIPMFTVNHRFGGVAFVTWSPDKYQGSSAQQAFNEMIAATDPNYVEVVINLYVENSSSTQIISTSSTMSDSQLSDTLDLVSAAGKKTFLTLHIDDRSPRSGWGGTIGLGFTSDNQWHDWFRSYDRIITHIAALAQGKGVDLLSIGNEFRIATQGHKQEWDRVIADVRSQYKGHITYSAFYGGEVEYIPFWDNPDIDYIGVNAYVQSDHANPSADYMAEKWRDYLTKIETIAHRFGKKVIITETGCASALGASEKPSSTNSGRLDLAEQLHYFQGLSQVLPAMDSIIGVVVWYYSPDPKAGGSSDSSVVLNGKTQTLKIISDAFAKLQKA
jgi:flagellar basal body-associated protein FliL